MSSVMGELSEGELQAIDRLDDLESRVLSFDKARVRGEDWRPSVHALFRETHNLKSFLAMIGHDGASRVMHELETRLDELRSGKLLPDDSWTDAMLKASDAARADISGGSPDGGSADLDEAVSKLRALVRAADEASETKPAPPALEVGFPLTSAEAALLARCDFSKEKTFILEKLVESGMSEEKIAELPIFSTLGEEGRVIAWRTKDAGNAGSVLSVLFSTETTADDLSFIVFDPFYPVSPPRTERPLRIPRLLIVDDDEFTVLVLQHYLAPYGRVDTATRGGEALEKFRTALAGDPYSAVFLDIMMPDMDGHQTLDKLREIEQGAGVLTGEGCRVVMASALSDFQSISSSFRGQCDAYLVKPFARNAVSAAMRKFGLEPISLDDSLVPGGVRTDGR